MHVLLHPIALGVFGTSVCALWALGYFRLFRVDYRSYQFIWWCLFCLLLNTLNLLYWSKKSIVSPFPNADWTFWWVVSIACVSAAGLIACLIHSRDQDQWTPAFFLLFWAALGMLVLFSYHMVLLLLGLFFHRIFMLWRRWRWLAFGQIPVLMIQLFFAGIGLSFCYYATGSLEFGVLRQAPLSSLYGIGIILLHICVFCELSFSFFSSLIKISAHEWGVSSLLWLFLITICQNFLTFLALMRMDFSPFQKFWQIGGKYLFSVLAFLALGIGIFVLLKKRKSFSHTFFDSLVFQSGILLLLLSLSESVAFLGITVYLTFLTITYFTFLLFFADQVFFENAKTQTFEAAQIRGSALLKLYYIAGSFPSPFFLLHGFLVCLFLSQNFSILAILIFCIFFIWNILWLKKFLFLNIYLFKNRVPRLFLRNQPSSNKFKS